MKVRSVFLITLVFVLQASARADEKGLAIVRSAFGKLGGAKTMSANIQSISPTGTGSATLKGTVMAMKPNLLKVVFTSGNQTTFFVSDGKAYYSNFQTPAKSFRKQPVLAKPFEFLGMWEGEIDAFFGGAANADRVTITTVTTEKVAGMDCDVVTVKVPGPPERTIIYAIGKADKSIIRATVTFKAQNGRTITQTNHLTNIKLNPPLKASDFVFKTPPGSKEVKPQGNRGFI
jgi:outer membrane lipoprotein-sorting protein